MTYSKILNILLWLIRITALGASLMLFVMIFNQYFLPAGKLEIEYDFSEDSEFIAHLEPWQRLTPIENVNGDWFQSMTDDLVYFNVKIPRLFQTITAEITFQNDVMPVLEIGSRADSAGNYLSVPIQNKRIDSVDWPVLTSDGVNLYQKINKYKDIQSFIANPPEDELIGEYYYDLAKDTEKNQENKTVIKIDNNTDIDSLDYIITKYNKPTYSGWTINSATFDMARLYKDDRGDLRFRISAPGLNESDGAIKISKIKIIYQKPPITVSNILPKIKNKINNLFSQD